MNNAPAPSAAGGLRRTARRLICATLSAALIAPAWAQPQTPMQAPTLISTERAAQAQTQAETQVQSGRTGEDARVSLLAALDRSEVAQALADRGLSAERARERVAALTDEEALELAARIDHAPAGASEIIGTLLFVFVLLLITDILGFTKIFPFTRASR